MTRTTRLLIVFSIGLLGLSVASPVAAAEDTPTPCPICHRANSQTNPYAEKAASTLVRGALNTAFGWTELLVRPASEVQNKGNLVTGVGKGVSFAVKRTALGLGELVTFWMPRSKDHPAPLATDCPICHTALAQPSPQTPAQKSR